MQLGRKLAEGYAVDISDEPELSAEIPPSAALVVASDDVVAADVTAVPVQV